jgi:hypothetical protein
MVKQSPLFRLPTEIRITKSKFDASFISQVSIVGEFFSDRFRGK